MNIKPIKTKKDYEDALETVNELWEAKPNTKNGDDLEVLTVLIEQYENNNYQILPPNPIEAIKFRMEQMGLTQKDLCAVLGANRVSEVLNKKRSLSLGMIKVLRANLNIPADSLIN
jgi:HTH-type transcriptional regulator/antitoxin HigA